MKTDLPHLAFEPMIFEEVSEAYPENVCKRARYFLEREREVAESDDLIPPNSRPGGNGIRPSPSGHALELEQLADLLSAYRDARYEKRKAKLEEIASRTLSPEAQRDSNREYEARFADENARDIEVQTRSLAAASGKFRG
jgi:hypothetical protein